MENKGSLGVMAHQRGQLDQVLALREGTCDETPFAGSCPSSVRVNTRGLPGDRHKGKNAEMRGLSWPLSGPLTPGDAFDAGRADARCRLRSSPLAASHHACG